jgi:hypothetical protein
MGAKENHKLKLLTYLSDPDNEYPSRTDMATEICGISKVTFYDHFTPDEISEIEAEALAARRQKYSNEIAQVDRAVLKAARGGDAKAAKLAYQRFEGWSEKQKHEMSGDLLINITETIVDPKET